MYFIDEYFLENVSNKSYLSHNNKYISFVIISSVFASFSTESHAVSVGSELGDGHAVGDAVIETSSGRGAADAACISAVLLTALRVIIVTVL